MPAKKPSTRRSVVCKLSNLRPTRRNASARRLAEGLAGRTVLASRVRVLPFGADETVVWEGEQGDSMYIIHAGACEILKDDGHGSNSRVAVIQKGNFFGEMSLLMNAARSANVQALEDSEAEVLNKDEFLGKIQNDPQFALNMITELADRVDQLHERAGGRHTGQGSRQQEAPGCRGGAVCRSVRFVHRNALRGPLALLQVNLRPEPEGKVRGPGAKGRSGADGVIRDGAGGSRRVSRGRCA